MDEDRGNVRSIRDADARDVGAAARLGRRLGTGDAETVELRRTPSCPVPGGDGEPGVRQVRGHGRAHRPESEERDATLLLRRFVGHGRHPGGAEAGPDGAVSVASPPSAASASEPTAAAPAAPASPSVGGGVSARPRATKNATIATTIAIRMMIARRLLPWDVGSS